MQYIKIDSDMWADAGKVWFVHKHETNPNSTAVKLTIEDTTNGEIQIRTVPQNQIEWLEPKDF
jgi:hypothetical protein